MTYIKLGYDPNEKYGWRILKEGECADRHFLGEMYNGKLLVQINAMLWEKVKNIKKIQVKGFDAPIMIDGKRRTGKSTVEKTIAYLLNPDISINNFVIGLEDSADKIENARECDPLCFDEAILMGGSKDAMAKKQKQLSKVIDVAGQKRLCLIFCMPSFFEMNRTLAVNHSLFLIHIYTDTQLNRGHFAFFGTKKKRLLYELGKKNQNSYSKPTSDFTGDFVNFELPFESEYIQLKKLSLREALNPDQVKKKDKNLTESDHKTIIMANIKEKSPHITDEQIWTMFGIGKSEFYRRKKRYKEVFAKK